MCLKIAVCRCPFPHVLINLLLQESHVCSFSNLSRHENIIRTECIKYPNLYSVSKTLLQQAIWVYLLKPVSGCAHWVHQWCPVQSLTTPVVLRLNFEVSIPPQMHLCIVLIADTGQPYILRLKEKEDSLQSLSKLQDRQIKFREPI